MTLNNNQFTISADLEYASPTIWPAFGLPLPEELPNPIPLESLETKEMFIIISRLVSESIRCDQSKDALEILQRLRLVKQNRVKRQDLFREYYPLINLLKFVSLSIRKDEEIIYLFENGILEAFQAGIDIKAKIYDSLSLGGYPIFSDEYSRVRNFIYALEHNQQVLGIEPIVIKNENRKLEPTLGNWIKDYNNLNIGKSGSVAKAAYLAQGLNINKLSTDYQTICLSLIELYDYLKGLSLRLLDKKDISILQREKIVIPDINQIIEGKGNISFTGTKQSIPLENIKEYNVPLSEVSAPLIEKKDLDSKRPAFAKVMPVAPARPIAQNIKPSFSPGLKMENAQFQTQNKQQSTSDIRQIRNEIEEKKILAQKQIDEKLEDLRNRQTPVK
jgi:hypothetical protein